MKNLSVKLQFYALTLFLIFSFLSVSHTSAQNTSPNDALLTWDFEVGCTDFSEDKDDIRDQIPVETLSDDICLQVCEGSTVNYSLIDVYNSINTVSWNITGGNIVSSNGTDLEVEWGATGVQAAISVTVTYDDGEQVVESQCVEIIPSPNSSIGIAGPENDVFCVNSDINFLNLSTANGGSQIVAQQWNVSDSSGNIVFSSNTFEPIFNFPNSGVYEVVLTTWNECNCSHKDGRKIIVERDALPISCPTVTCENSIETYVIDDPDRRCESFEWKAQGGNIIGSFKDPMVDVLWDEIDENGFGYLSFLQEGCEGACPGWTTVKIPVVTTKGFIKGDTDICQNDQYRYTLPQWPTTDFEWKLFNSSGTDVSNNQVIVTGQRNEIIVDTNNLPAGTYYLESEYNNTLLKCGGAASKKIVVSEQLTIEAPEVICAGEVSITPSVLNVAISYNIFLNGDLVNNVQGQGVYDIDLLESGSYIITATASGYCIGTPVVVEVLPVPEQPDPQSLAGAYNLPNEVCLNTPYQLTFNNSDANSVVLWEAVAPNNSASIQGTNLGNTVGVVFTSYPAQIKLQRVSKTDDACASEFRTITLNEASVAGIVRATPDASITTYCSSTTAQFMVDPIDGVEAYEWSFETENFGSIVTGQDTNVVTVLFNEISNNNPNDELRLRVRKCGVWFELNGSVPYITPLEISLIDSPTATITNVPTQICPSSDISVTVNLSQSIDFATTQGISASIDGVNDTTIGYPTSGSGNSFVLSGISIPATNLGTSTSLTRNLEVTITGANGCTIDVTDQVVLDVFPAPVVTASLDGNSVNSFCLSSDIDTQMNISTVSINSIVGYALYSVSGPSGTLPGTFVRNISATSLTINPTDGFGWYVVEVTDSNGCKGYSNPFRVSMFCPNPCNAPQITVNASWDSCNTINATGSVPAGYIPGTLSWGSTNNDGISLVSSSTTAAQFTVSKPGDYLISVSATYLINGVECRTSGLQQVTVGYQSGIEYTATCGANGLYDVTIINTSEILSGSGPDQVFYEYEIGGVTTQLTPNVTNPNQASASLPPGIYTLEVRLTAAGRPTCSSTVGVTIEALQVPIFEVRSSKAPGVSGSIIETCTECPVQLLIDPSGAGPQANLSYRWEFSDTANLTIEPEITLPEGANREIKLIVTDEFGCTEESSYTLNVFANNANIRVEDDISICDGDQATLNAVDFFNELRPNQPVQWMQGDTEIIGATNLTYSTSVQGTYWVKTYGPNGCENTSNNNVFVAVKAPPFIELDGVGTVCAGQAFEITAVVEPGVNYTWLKDGVAISGQSGTATGTSISLTQTLNSGGTNTYVYALQVEKDGCTNVQAISIDVVNADSFDVVISSTECSPFQVKLEAIDVPAGAFINWSNGASGTTDIFVNSGGWISATIALPSGCTFTKEVFVPHSPEEYVWIFPSGCIDLCLIDKPVDHMILGPLALMDSWEWQFNGNATAPLFNSGPSQTLELNLATTNSSGLFNLQLDIDPCTITSDPLQVTYNEECRPCKLEIKEGPYLKPNASGNYNLIGLLDLSNSSFPLTIDLFEGQSQGYFLPATISLVNPVNYFDLSSIQFVPFTNAPLQVTQLGITITSEKGTCEDRFTLRAIDQVASKLSNASLKIVPNPATSGTELYFEMEEDFAAVDKSIELYTTQGILLKKINLKEILGTVHLPLEELPTGTYLVLLKAGDVNVDRQLLIKK